MAFVEGTFVKANWYSDFPHVRAAFHEHGIHYLEDTSYLVSEMLFRQAMEVYPNARVNQAYGQTCV